jgi:hypothetical protein
MRLYHKIKAGVQLAPAYLIFFYYLVAILDMYSTFLVTPDFKHEVNWFVLYLDLNWLENIILYSTIVVVNSLCFAYSINYIYSISKKFGKHESKSGFHYPIYKDIKAIISYIFIGCFYSHLITISLFIINNILNYFYVAHANTYFKVIGNWYVLSITSKYPKYLIYFQVVTILIGYSLALFKIVHIQSISSINSMKEKVDDKI